jgi:hypothetical protein
MQSSSVSGSISGSVSSFTGIALLVNSGPLLRYLVR